MASRCDFGDRMDSVVRDLFVTHMQDSTLQRNLCIEQMTPEATLRDTFAYEQGLSRQRNMLATLAPASITPTAPHRSYPPAAVNTFPAQARTPGLTTISV